jgi:hypothetical protein
LKDWTAKVKSGQAALQDEVLQANRWHDKIRADQSALLGGSASGTFDRVSVAGIEFGDYLISQGWKPRIGAKVRFQRILHPAPNVDAVLLYLDHFQVPYTNNPVVVSSELLPLKLRSGAVDVVVNDPWTLMDLGIEMTDTGYELSLDSR